MTEIRVERLLTAPIERVYAAWTRPELLGRWYCPNPKLELDVKADVRPGGSYVVTMGPHVVRGVYQTVEPPRLLVFSWKWDSSDAPASQVRVELTVVPDGTQLVLTHTDLESAEDATGHREGWELELARLEELLSGE